MIIVEFVGCPGVGKSVISNSVVNYLHEEEFTTPKPYKYTKHFKTLRRWFFDCKAFLDPTCKKLRKHGKKLVADLDNPDRKRWFKQVIRYTYKIKIAEKHNIDYYVLEEGILQALTSIDHDKEISSGVLEWTEYIIKEVYSKYKIFVFLCEVDEKTNIMRLKGRNKPDDRFLKGTDEEIRLMLKRKKENIEIVCNRMDENVIRVNVRDKNIAQREIINNLVTFANK